MAINYEQYFNELERERSPAECGHNDWSQHFIPSIKSDSCVNIYQNGEVLKMASRSQNVIKL